MPRYQRAIVVGASSGIGEEITKQLAAEGTLVAAIARRIDKLEALAHQYEGKIVPVEHDVTQYDKVPDLFLEVTQRLGGLDLIVYAAGVMPEVGWHEYCFEKDKAMFEVNVLGAMAWLNEAACRFENTKRGTIVAIGSVAGDRGRGGQPAYNATKAALATYMEALRNRIGRYGVKVVLVKPGPTSTPMTANLQLRGAMPAPVAAQLILAKSDSSGEHYLKFTHKVAFAIIRNIPSWLFQKLKI